MSSTEIGEIDIRNVEPKLNEKLLQYFLGETDGYVQVGPKKWFYPMKYKKIYEDYLNFEVRPDDVWITGIPRSGTTITQELAWLLCNDLDFDKTKHVSMDERVRFFDLNIVMNEKTLQDRLKKFPSERMNRLKLRCENTMRYLNESQGRRIIKTHLPFELLPPDLLRKGCKVIYLCRYPKDVAVSFYHLQSTSWHVNYSGTFQEYWTFFQNGNCMFGPYFEHVKQGFEKRDCKNFLFVFYEDIKKDLDAYIDKISKFLERPLNTKELDEIKNYLNFDNFKKTINTTEIQLVRDGKTGGWESYFTVEMNEKSDEWIAKNTAEIGLKFSQEK